MPDQTVLDGVSRRHLPSRPAPGAGADHSGAPYSDLHYAADLRAARYHAHRIGLCDADCDDCAMEFVLSRLLRAQAGAADPADAAWRHRCASNFAKNALRSRVTRARLEMPASDVLPWEAVSGDAPDPAGELLRAEFWRELRRCCAAGLRPTSLQMFLRHYEDGESIQELAAAFREKPHAVEQKLHRARRRLRQLLTERGIDAEALTGDLRQIANGKTTGAEA